MNIALLHYSAPPVVGGVEAVIGHQSRLMAGAGHTVRVIAGRGEQTDARVPFEKLHLADSRHPEVLAVKKELDRGEVPAKFDRLVTELASSLTQLTAQTDILVAHNVCSLNKNLPLTAALHHLSGKKSKPRLILWHHDLAWSTPRYRSELHEGHPWNLLKQAWPGVTQVTVSEMRRDELAELHGVDKNVIHVIPNGIDPAGFLNLDPQSWSFITRLNLATASPILLLPVRITPRKNIELAIHTLAALRRTFPAARLLVTGPLGPHNPANRDYFEQLRALRKELRLMDAVHFLAEMTDAFLPDRVISDFYRLADALLLPSREEGFGLPLLEAGLAGVPVFCADIPTLKSLGLENAHYFSPDERPEQVAGVIADHLHASRVFKLRASVKIHYTWERVYADKIAPLLV